MTDCLTENELELIQNRALRGSKLLAALRHLEGCESCRSQIALPSAQTILKRFEKEDVVGGKSDSSKYLPK